MDNEIWTMEFRIHDPFQNRAMSVTNYFTGTKGLSAGRFTTSGLGKQVLLLPTIPPRDVPQNRKVNIVIVPNERR